MNSIIRVEVDLSAVAHNIRELKRITNEDVRFMAVVKANGYGHGAVRLAKAALENGADYLGVARIDEAIELREAGIQAPILIFSHTPEKAIDSIIRYDLAQTVYDCATAKALSDAAETAGAKIKIHLKVDTGMGRLGIIHPSIGLPEQADKALSAAASIYKLNGLEFEGLFTHFASSDSLDKTYVMGQLEYFLDFANLLHQKGIDIPVKHAANSGAIIDLPQSHLDMVRAGLSIYGLYPSSDVDKLKVRLKPAMTIKTGILQVKKVPAGFKISYNSTYETQHPTTIAAVQIGYGDGYSRLLSNKGQMLVHGRRVPIVGRICMDLTMLDVGEIEDVFPGDEVVVMGKQEKAEITAGEIADLTSTINYEVVTAITARAPRIYVHSGESL